MVQALGSLPHLRDWVQGSWVQPALALAAAGIREVNHQIEDLSLLFSLCFPDKLALYFINPWFLFNILKPYVYIFIFIPERDWEQVREQQQANSSRLGRARNRSRFPALVPWGATAGMQDPKTLLWGTGAATTSLLLVQALFKAHWSFWIPTYLKIYIRNNIAFINTCFK